MFIRTEKALKALKVTGSKSLDRTGNQTRDLRLIRVVPTELSESTSRQVRDFSIHGIKMNRLAHNLLITSFTA